MTKAELLDRLSEAAKGLNYAPKCDNEGVERAILSTLDKLGAIYRELRNDGKSECPAWWK